MTSWRVNYCLFLAPLIVQRTAHPGPNGFILIIIIGDAGPKVAQIIGPILKGIGEHPAEADVRHYWSLVVTIGHYGSLLVTIVSLWVTSGHYWALLGTIGHY